MLRNIEGTGKMENWKCVFVGILCYAAFASTVGAVKLSRSQPTERISGLFPLHLPLFASVVRDCHVLLLSIPMLLIDKLIYAIL